MAIKKITKEEITDLCKKVGDASECVTKFDNDETWTLKSMFWYNRHSNKVRETLTTTVVKNSKEFTQITDHMISVRELTSRKAAV